ncbi:hypothetical protein [Rhodoplanes sp. Z2-YC6860]|uniref:hypothetical protein n=1 Tax=Rhodoplanes sp. Z2-YC6860 TaxID=674703 RepID=UPI00082F9D55|nr:hypothetical protein [Rhodoplanes sp. Z2-YC6860]
MKRALFFVAIVAAMSFVGSPDSIAQSAAPDTAAVTGMKPDRVTAPRWMREGMQKREAVKRKKRAECRAKAKAEKVPLFKRPAYVKGCTTQSN